MGIKGLRVFLSGKTKAIKTVGLEKFSGETHAIDVSGLMYKYMFRSIIIQTKNMGSEEYEIDNEEQLKSYLRSFLQFIRKYLKSGVIPIFVFDGVPPEEKNSTLRVRKEKREKMTAEIETVQEELKNGNYASIAQYRDLLRKCPTLSKIFWDSLFELLDSLGLPYVSSKNEAEKLCCMFAADGKVDAVFSNDSDAIVYDGVKKVLYLNEDKGKKEPFSFKIMRKKRILKDLEMNQKNFLDLCIMFGTDYNHSIPGIGVVGAFKLIQEYGKINKIPEDVLKKKYRANKEETERLERMTKAERKEYKKMKMKDRLKYKKCREMFSYVASEELIDTEKPHRLEIDFEIFKDKAKDVLVKYGLKEHYSSLKEMLNSIVE